MVIRMLGIERRRWKSFQFLCLHLGDTFHDLFGSLAHIRKGHFGAWILDLCRRRAFSHGPSISKIPIRRGG